MFIRHLLDFSLLPPPPPPPSPPLSGDNGGVTGVSSSHSSTNNLKPSIEVITTIVIGVVVLSTTVHLLLRYINRHCNLIESDEEEEEEDEVVMANIEPAVHVHQRISSRRVAPDDDDHHKNLIDSLPLFTFNSINKLAVADCAVCLSKFEPPDQLRLLPICCHAFHSNCIDTWLASNDTCPLCRSTVHVAESDGYLKLFSASTARENSSSSQRRSNSFRIEIGSVSRRRVPTDSGRFRSYSMGSFDYLVDDELEVEVEVVVAEPPTHSHSDGRKKDGGDVYSSEAPPPVSAATAEVAGGRGWLRDYVDRLVSSSASSLSSRSRSFSGRFFTGSARRRSDGGGGFNGGGSWDLEASGYGEEISSFFRWLSGI